MRDKVQTVCCQVSKVTLFVIEAKCDRWIALCYAYTVVKPCKMACKLWQVQQVWYDGNRRASICFDIFSPCNFGWIGGGPSTKQTEHIPWKLLSILDGFRPVVKCHQTASVLPGTPVGICREGWDIWDSVTVKCYILWHSVLQVSDHWGSSTAGRLPVADMAAIESAHNNLAAVTSHLLQNAGHMREKLVGSTCMRHSPTEKAAVQLCITDYRQTGLMAGRQCVMTWWPPAQTPAVTQRL